MLKKIIKRFYIKRFTRHFSQYVSILILNTISNFLYRRTNSKRPLKLKKVKNLYKEVSYRDVLENANLSGIKLFELLCNSPKMNENSPKLTKK